MRTLPGVLAVLVTVALSLSACDQQSDQPQQPVDGDVSVDEQTSPGIENYPEQGTRDDGGSQPPQ